MDYSTSTTDHRAHTLFLDPATGNRRRRITECLASGFGAKRCNSNALDCFRECGAVRALPFLEFSPHSFFEADNPAEPAVIIHSSSSVQGELLVTCFKTAVCLGTLLLSATPVLPRIHGLPAETPPDPLMTKEAPSSKSFASRDYDTSRRRSCRPVKNPAKASHSTLPKIDKDLRALATLGWFESIQVEEVSSNLPSPQALENQKHIALIFHLEERPFLSKVQYSGSRLLSQKQIEKMLEDKSSHPLWKTSRSSGAPTDCLRDSLRSE